MGVESFFVMRSIFEEGKGVGYRVFGWIKGKREWGRMIVCRGRVRG